MNNLRAAEIYVRNALHNITYAMGILDSTNSLKCNDSLPEMERAKKAAQICLNSIYAKQAIKAKRAP